MIEKEGFSGRYIGLGHLMLEQSLAETSNSPKPPDSFPELAEEGSIVQFIPITEAQLNGETPLQTEPYTREQTRERLQHLGEAYKRRLKPGEIGIRAVWSEPNDSTGGIVERRKEYVTVAHDLHSQLEIIHPDSQDPSFVFYPHNPVAYPDQTWWGLKNNSDKPPQPNGKEPTYIEASAKYHDQKTFLSFEEVLAAPSASVVISASELKRRILDKNETQLIDAQAIAAVAKYLYSKEVGAQAQNPEATSPLERPDHPYHPVSVPTQETNPWFDIDVAGQTLSSDVFATQAIYVGEKKELINPTTNEAITIQVTENLDATTIEDRFIITLQSELSPNHYLDPVKVAIGGGVEKDETATQAMGREEGEETGKKGELIHLGGKIHRADILRCSTDVFITLNPHDSDEKLVGDESERSTLHHYSISEIKRQITEGKIADAATIAALLKTTVFLESMPSQAPEINQIDQIKKEVPQPANEKMLDLISAQLANPKYDALRPLLSKIPELGIIQNKNGSNPEFSAEGAQFAQLMKDGSKVILENATSFNEYREMMSVFLEIIESSANYKVLGINREQLDQLRAIYTTIIGETVNLFKDIRGNDFKEVESENLKMLKSAAQGNASKSGSKHSFEIVQVLEPTLSVEQARLRVENLRNSTTVQDLYRIAAEVLGYTGRAFPKNGIDLLENLLAQKTNDPNGGEVLKHAQFLPDTDLQKLADIVMRSGKKENEANTTIDRTCFAVLDGIHLSWAASRALLSKEKLDAKQYTPMPALLLQRYQERMTELNPHNEHPSETDIDQAILVAVIDLMKDLIYLEV